MNLRLTALFLVYDIGSHGACRRSFFGLDTEEVLYNMPYKTYNNR